ncbi:MAG: hypothetical protein P1V97_39650 [Planctomycetota bacterium]|nr:hypothetical protein [Planctomycetota bacterium]
MTQKFFLYLYCENLSAMRRFYSETVGLSESFYAPAEALAYDINGLQFTIFDSHSVDGKAEGWARQPGWNGGEANSMSWSIQLSEPEFNGAIQRLSLYDDPAFYERPHWNGYWSFPVKDPEGNTVELSLAPSQEPESKTWTLGF